MTKLSDNRIGDSGSCGARDDRDRGGWNCSRQYCLDRGATILASQTRSPLPQFLKRPIAGLPPPNPISEQRQSARLFRL